MDRWGGGINIINLSRAREGCTRLAEAILKLRGFKAGLEAGGVDTPYYSETISDVEFALNVMKHMLSALEEDKQCD